MSTQSIILLVILTALIVPVIYIYAYHVIHEIETSADAKEKGNETKYLRATSEGYFVLDTTKDDSIDRPSYSTIRW